MENTNQMPGTAPISQPPVQNPAQGQYMAATGQQPVQQPVQPSTNPATQPTTLDDILAAVRGQGVLPTQGEQPPVQQDKTESKVEPPISIDMHTGNDALDVAVETFVTAAGATDADIQRAVFKAIEYGDVGLIDEAFIQERFGDKAEQALKLARAVVQQTNERTTQTINTVYSMAGSKEQWEAAVDVFKNNATPGLSNAVKAMLDSGNMESTKEAAELILNFGRQSGAIPNVNSRIKPSAGNVLSQGISAAELTAAINKLNPNSRTYNQDYQKLIDLRRLGKQLGK